MQQQIGTQPRALSSPSQSQAGLAFFFLFLYTISVLIRPHEFSPETAEYVFIKVFAITSFVLTLLTLRPIKLQPQHLMLIGLTPFIIVSGFLNGWGMGGIEQSERLITSSIIPFFLYTSLVTSIKRQKLLMLVCLAAAWMMVYNGHIQQASFDGIRGYGLGDSITVGREEMRISYLGFFSDPNDLGMFIVMCIPFTVYLMVKGGGVMKLLMLTTLIAIGYGIYMTGSRGTLLGALAVIAAYYFIKKAGAKLIITGAALAPVVATLMASFGGLSSDDSSAHGRLDAWYDGVLMLLHNPVFGVGMGNFMEEHGKVAHNSYIHVAGELGIPGYSLWGTALILNMLAGYDMIKKHSNWKAPDEKTQLLYNEEMLVNKVLFYSMVGFMVTAFFLSRQFTLTMFIFMGMQTASLVRIIRVRPELAYVFQKKNILKSLGMAWCIIIAVYMALKVGL
ncbi:O-antigen ligase family protein [Alteromonas sp. CYL-A6]|uniref:O-antigen ligase family protein n=1 Tax=Alteromonas nitratireducens TaxID=3390813 RepID=UPI0034ABF8B6